jgi:hypothetical protein
MAVQRGLFCLCHAAADDVVVNVGPPLHVIGGIVWALESNTTRASNGSAQVGNSGTSPAPSSLLAALSSLQSEPAASSRPM